MKGTAVRGRILVVDDSALMRELLVTQLEVAGFNVSAVDGGHAALDALSLERFDVVILDVQMPGMDGIDLGIALRANRSTARVSIVMHTTLAEAEVRRRFSGYDAYLQKPCDPRQLKRCIAELVPALPAGGGGDASL